jgi:DNA-binding XRE family transcriptional regulator
MPTPNIRGPLPGVKYSIYCYSECRRSGGMSEKIGSRIRALRLEKKLTLDELAEKAGLSKSYLWELENKDRSTISWDQTRQRTCNPQKTEPSFVNMSA